MPIFVKLISERTRQVDSCIECNFYHEIENKLKAKYFRYEYLNVTLNENIIVKDWVNIGTAVKFNTDYDVVDQYYILACCTIGNLPNLFPKKKNYNYSIDMPYVVIQPRKPQKCEIQFLLIKSDKLCENIVNAVDTDEFFGIIDL